MLQPPAFLSHTLGLAALAVTLLGSLAAQTLVFPGITLTSETQVQAPCGPAHRPEVPFKASIAAWVHLLGGIWL